MVEREIEVFTTGGAGCAPAVALVEDLAGPDCAVVVRDMRDVDTAVRALGYGITRVPAVVVDGSVAACCRQGGPTREGLVAAGVGRCADTEE